MTQLNGPKIRLLMKQRSLTVTKLAKLVDVNHSHISNIIAGRRKPSIDLALKLSSVLGTTVNDLV